MNLAQTLARAKVSALEQLYAQAYEAQQRVIAMSQRIRDGEQQGAATLADAVRTHLDAVRGAAQMSVAMGLMPASELPKLHAVCRQVGSSFAQARNDFREGRASARGMAVDQYPTFSALVEVMADQDQIVDEVVRDGLSSTVTRLGLGKLPQESANVADEKTESARERRRSMSSR